jgi:DNA repair protein RadC
MSSRVQRAAIDGYGRAGGLRARVRASDAALLAAVVAEAPEERARLARRARTALRRIGLAALARLERESWPTQLELTGDQQRRLRLAFELGRRAYDGRAPALCAPGDVLAWCADLRAADRERFVAIDLDARHRVLRRRLVSVGTLTASLVHPREVFAPALRAGAAALVVAHNHPSGDPEPSAEDCALTERLREAARLLGIELLDHLVIGRASCVSLRERGVL